MFLGRGATIVIHLLPGNRLHSVIMIQVFLYFPVHIPGFGMHVRPAIQILRLIRILPVWSVMPIINPRWTEDTAENQAIPMKVKHVIIVIQEGVGSKYAKQNF